MEQKEAAEHKKKELDVAGIQVPILSIHLLHKDPRQRRVCVCVCGFLK